MTASSTSLSIALLAALLVGSNAQCADNCIPTLANAQSCLRECGNKDPVPEWGGRYNFETNGSSRLFQCLPDFNENAINKNKVFDQNDRLNDLALCCEMSDECKQTMMDAKQCATPQGQGGSGCIRPCVKNHAKQYLGCILNESNKNIAAGQDFSVGCQFSSLCVGQLTGSDTFDFAATLAQDANRASVTECSSMDGFVDGICEISDRCCDQCNLWMARLSQCLVNHLILPASEADPGTQCDIRAPVQGGNVGQCRVTGLAGPTATGRSSATEEETSSEEFDVEGVDISDCEERLTLEFIVNNATQAADGFMQCIGKKMGKVLTEAEGENASNPEPPASATTATLMLFGTAMVASSVWSMLA